MPGTGFGVAARDCRVASSELMGQAPSAQKTKKTTKNGGGDKKMLAASAAPAPFGSMGVSTGKKMTMASALVGEKIAHLRADLRLGFYRLAHPVHPQVRRIAAQESTIAQKSVATERRRQQEAKARAIANEKRAVMRQARRARTRSL